MYNLQCTYSDDLRKDNRHRHPPYNVGSSRAYINHTSFRQFEIQSKLIEDGVITTKEFSDLQELDTDIMSLEGTLVSECGIICIKDNGQRKPVLPTCLSEGIIMQLHYLTDNLHMSKKQILDKIKENYYLINARALIEKLTSNCGICLVTKVPRLPKHSLHMGKYLTTPRASYTLDVLGAIGVSTHGYRYLFVCIENATSYCLIGPSKNKSADSIKNFLLQSVIIPFGNMDL